MKPGNPLSGWKLTVYTLFLGPIFLCLHLWQYRKTYPLIRFLVTLPPAVLLLCAWLAVSLSASPNWIILLYIFLLAVIFAAVFIFSWTVASANKSRESSPRPKILFSRGIAWMTFMGTVFFSLAQAVQIINYWVFGEYVMVYFSSTGGPFSSWVLVGLIFGFIYGIDATNQYFNRDMKTFGISLALVFLLILVFSIVTLFLVVYPLQRLAPISYTPQTADVAFYIINGLSILLAVLFFLPGGVHTGMRKTVLVVMAAVPMIMLHAIVLSGYATTLNLIAASILEERGQLNAAKERYAKTIPYIDYDPLLASLHHRQGVLNVLNENYDAAEASFKKVIADYSEGFDVYSKASRYVESYRKNRSMPEGGRKILSVRHRTFEQAASCFPNSLSVILNFYETTPISTRKLSYAIKEGFSQGTFIWKVEAFLHQRDYRLMTTFWERKETLIDLLEAGFPVLIYVPGHVYTLYGYDARMEIFFCYNTAKRNRWDDAPFFEFQRDWMEGGFLMSVVVKKGEEQKLAAIVPGMIRHSASHQLYQKAMISDYYAQKDNYWEDGDRHQIAEGLGVDALKLNQEELHANGFRYLPWNEQQWREELAPDLTEKWSIQWDQIERHAIYLLFHRQVETARRLVQQYQNHSNEDGYRNDDRLLELSLAVEIADGNHDEALSLSDKIIGKTGRHEDGISWGHYFKAANLLEKGELKRAADLLLPLLDKIDLGYTSSEANARSILVLLAKIQQRQPSLIEPDKARLLDIYRIRFAM
ncbi:MAG: hypothetical protein ACOZF0_07050 [Thermodesulfobacteriota bacterium]